MLNNKILYRYEIIYSDYDGNSTQVILLEYPVIKETDYTYFLKITKHSQVITKQVRKGSFNTFAWPTIHEAKEHFIRRTTQRVRWYRFWRSECKRALKIINTK